MFDRVFGKEEVKFYPVHPVKFIFLSIITFNVYAYYWMYRCWKYVKVTERSNIWPFWRTVFSGIFIYFLSKRIFIYRDKSFPAIILISFFIIDRLVRLPAPYDILTIFSFVPVLFMVVEVNISHNYTKPVSYLRFGVWHLLLSILLIPCFVYSFMTDIGYFPYDRVIPGDYLWRKDIEWLRSIGGLDKNEIPKYYYSEGFLGSTDFGVYYTDNKAVAFGLDEESGQYAVQTVYFSEISELKRQECEGFWCLEAVEVIPHSGESLYLYYPSGSFTRNLFYTSLSDLLIQKKIISPPKRKSCA